MPNPQIFGFFHPYCSGGGGGERVLWKLIQVLQRHDKKAVIYTIDPSDTDEAQLRLDAERRFDVQIPNPVQLVSLEEFKDYLLPSPYLSLVLESYGTMKLAQKALLKFQPDVFWDTTGCAFTFCVARWMLPSTSWILAYVHYPTISTDMMLWEWQKTGRARWKTLVKLIYYWMFAILYGMVGSLADLVLVNSTWTFHHIQRLWRFSKQNIYIVYPPCRVPTVVDNNTNNKAPQKRSNTIVSIGQFRPEKNHALQIQALATVLKQHPEHKDIKLLLIGSCRNESDRQRVDDLRKLVTQLELDDFVEFNINPPYSELQASMQTASMGIHTMRQEHFGIGIVEMMAAGLLTIAHNSGGPSTDIIVEPGITGYLATTADDYANAIHQALTLSDAETMRQKAQAAATRFSDDVFDESMERVVLPQLMMMKQEEQR